MHLSDTQRDLVRFIFNKLKTRKELVDLLNAVKRLLDQPTEGSVFQPIDLGELLYYADERRSGSQRYRQFTIKKKNGGERMLAAPVYPLKQIQTCIAVVLSALYEPPAAVTGFIAGRSITDNAAPHVGKAFVFNIDLKDFFPSIHLHRVKAVFKLPPYNLVGEREPLAYLLARLCCHENRDGLSSLPQGAPTSPVVSNMICQQLDRRLNGLAKRYGALYTRYADDITFSAQARVFHGSFEQEMNRILATQRLTLNQAKVRMQGPGYRQEVTGLIVNQKTNVTKRYLHAVRAMLHNWDKLGYEPAERIFQQHYQLDKGVTKQSPPQLRTVLEGKLNYLKMVRGADDPLFRKYRLQFDRLTGRTPAPVDVLTKLETILSIWEQQTLDKALDHGPF